MFSLTSPATDNSEDEVRHHLKTDSPTAFFREGQLTAGNLPVGCGSVLCFRTRLPWFSAGGDGFLYCFPRYLTGTAVANFHFFRGA
jgi:hypothetical protein